MLPPKPSKDVAVRYLQKAMPEYGWLLETLQKDGGRVRLNSNTYRILENLKVTDYAKVYVNELAIPRALMLAFFDPEELKGWEAELTVATDEERTAFLDEWAMYLESGEFDAAWDFELPKTPEDEARAQRLFEALDENEKAEAIRRGQYFFIFFMASFHNLLAVMVHGRKLTQLVAEAMAGDDDAFMMAVHIDWSILKAIPYFVEREERACQEVDTDFLETLGRWRSKPPLQGRIKFRLLFLLFAFLESFNLLDGTLTDTEILDLCDAAGLDRWQNRIEDVSYLRKRRLQYRRFQKHKRLY
ncbi:hypothetical protein [Methylocaldum sp.]|uniref:hypothetical protein n=1 Tax=Methylocaldum sp. TaxID=1969727 RepID=UPI002D272767|nr:hypothetical protein [Methylocaldum sp.]HYE36066.1 hypothetical protein [Methylocaldum sp.]